TSSTCACTARGALRGRARRTWRRSSDSEPCASIVIASAIPMSESRTVSSRFLPALLVLFVGSGCAALIYEAVWLQLLQLVIGSSAVAVAVLLGTFMGCMCIGSFLLPRVTSPRAHPLRIYAYLEIGIGAIGLLVLFGMPLVARVYTAWAGSG